MAATTTIREFLVGLGFKVDEAGMGKFTSAITSATTTAIALGAAVVAAAASVLAAVKHIAGEYDELDKLATRFRSAVDAIDEFNDVGGLLGLTNEQTVGGLTALDRAIGDTALGLGRAKMVFEEIGLQVLDTAGKMRPTVEVMDELGEKLKTMERGKAIAVMERLGLDPALLKIFNADLAGLRADLEAIDKAAGFDLGEAVANSKTFIKSWKALQVEFRKAQLVFSKMYEAIGVRLMPRLSAAVDEMRARVEQARKFIIDNLGALQGAISTALNVLLRLFSFVWALFGRVVDAVVGYVQLVINAFRSLDPTVQLLIGGVLGLVAAWRLLNLAFLASPVTWVLALGVALLALYDDYMTWQEGGESLIDWSKWKPGIDLLVAALDLVRNRLYAVFTAMFEVGGFIAGAFVAAWNAIGAAITNVIGIFQTAYGWITKIMDGISAVTSLGQFGTPGSSPLSAAPTAVLGASGGAAAGVTMNQNTTIQVQGGDAAATGRAVAGEQGRVNSDMVRNTKGATR